MPPSDDDDVPGSDVASRRQVISSNIADRAGEERRARGGIPVLSGHAVAGAELPSDDATLPGATRSAATGLDGSDLSADEVTVQLLRQAKAKRQLDDNLVLRLAEGIRVATVGFNQGDPRVLAFQLGIDAVPGRADADEPPTATEAVYLWHDDPRERGMRVYCALVHSFFLSRGIAYGSDDVWPLAVELALPTEDRWMGRVAIKIAQRFCPVAVIYQFVPEG